MKVIPETLTLIFTVFQPFDFERTVNIKVSVSGITFIWYAQGRKVEKQ
jgi:hypothetical protein